MAPPPDVVLPLNMAPPQNVPPRPWQDVAPRADAPPPASQHGDAPPFARLASAAPSAARERIDPLPPSIPLDEGEPVFAERMFDQDPALDDGCCGCPLCQGWPRPAVGDITVSSRFGPLHVGLDPPDPFTIRAGFVGTLGTHTIGIGHERGVSGILATDFWRLDYDVANTISAFAEQWGYSFPGIQNQTSVELLTGPRFVGGSGPGPGRPTFDFLVGMRLDWYFNRSFRQIGGDEVTVEDDHSPLSQRLGTYFIQCDWTDAWRLDRLRFSFTNDSAVTGGDGGDEFRTAQVRLRYLRQRGPWQARAGIGVDLFTGAVDRQRTTPDGAFYITDGLPFADRSQGLLELELGMSHYFRVGPVLSEVGFNIALGPDTEGIRDMLQNQWIHRGILGDVPQVPRIDRDDRFKFDVSVFLVIHFG